MLGAQKSSPGEEAAGGADPGLCRTIWDKWEAPPRALSPSARPHVPSVGAPPGLTRCARPGMVLLLLWGQMGSRANEAFNYGYWLVLQASESHLNAGNFKLFWQYKRASEWIPVTCALAFRLQRGARVM